MRSNTPSIFNGSPLFSATTTSVSGAYSRQQRVSVEDSAANLVQDIRNTNSRLSQLWDQVHMDVPLRESRIQQAYEYVHNLLRDIVSSEEQMVRSVATDLDDRRKAVTELRKLFKQPPFEESLYPSGSIALLKALDTEMNRLTKKREESMGKQLTLHEKYETYCRRTGTTRHYIEGVHERIFTDDEIGHLAERIKELRSLFNKRLESALHLQSEAKKIYDSIQLPTHNSISDEDLQCLRVDLHSPSTLLTQEVLNKLSSLNQRLKDHYDAWIEQVAFRYDELMIKLDALAAKCFRPPVSKDYPATLNPERLNERELQKLEAELQARKEVYERAQPVFDKLNEWMESWKQKLDTERRVCRASFYKNRAGSLNTKLKQRRMVEQKVPKLFNELQALCEDYTKQYAVYDIVVEGLRADQYAESVMRAYEEDREVQRAQKQFKTPSRAPLTPGRPQVRSPSRRNVFASSNAPTTCSTPTRSAMRNLNPYLNRQAPATVTGARSTRKRSFSCSESAIFPLKSSSSMSGPRTSSPKPDCS